MRSGLGLAVRGCVLLWVLALGVLGLGGCGASGPAGSAAAVPVVVPANLNGNWLLAGVLPSGGLPSGPLFGPVQFGLAMSFAVVGNEVVAAGTAQYACNGVNYGITFDGRVHGTIDAEGNFTAGTPPLLNANAGLQLTVTGVAPKTAQGSWSGTYTLQNAPLGNLPNPCTFSQTAAFTATGLANATGTYVGTGSVGGSPGVPGSPVTVTVQLQQGGPVTSSMTGVTSTDALLLTATVKIAGPTCNASGATGSAGTAPTSVGAVEGDHFIAPLRMEDGSQLLLDGEFLDAGATRMQTGLLGLPQLCGTQGLSLHVSELDKVN